MTASTGSIKRDFTEATWGEMGSTLGQELADPNPGGFNDNGGWSNFPATLKDDMSNVHKYLQCVADLNDFTAQDLVRIMQNVRAVENAAAADTKLACDNMGNYLSIVTNLNNEITGDFPNGVDYDALAAACAPHMSALNQYGAAYRQQLEADVNEQLSQIRIGDEEPYEYNYEYITYLFSKDPNTMTEAELLALSIAYNEMSEEQMANFISCGYTSYAFVDDNPSAPNSAAIYSATPGLVHFDEYNYNLQIKVSCCVMGGDQSGANQAAQNMARANVLHHTVTIMEKTKSTHLFLAGLLCLIMLLTLGGCYNTPANSLISSGATSQEILAEKYRYQYKAIYNFASPDFMNYNEGFENWTDYSLVINLGAYRQATGTIITLDFMKDYCAEEFEPDGSVRIYDNGNWPEIQSYVEWCNNNPEAIDQFSISITALIVRLEKVYPELAPYSVVSVGVHNLQELVEVYFDPDYVPNFIFPESSSSVTSNLLE